MITRRNAITTLALVFGHGLAGRPAWSAPALSLTDLRGSIDAGAAGLSSASEEDQTRRLRDLIDQARATDQWVFLPPGRYQVSDLALPDRTRLSGIAGATTIVFSGGRSFLSSEAGASRIELSNITIDGAGLPLPEEVPGLLHLRDVADLRIDNCEFRGCAKTAVQIERCGGRIERCRISDIGEYALYAIDSTGLAITDNTIRACGNGGILVHRSRKGEDRSIVSGNRISATGATYGGTGEFGNAINLYRADGVIVSGNQISDSAFTAIRANGSSNVQISDNQCFRSGETAIYSEFGFEGAIVTGNLIDGAANGINIANFNEGGRMAIVANNIVRNISATGPYVHDSVGFGIGIGVEADTVVSANLIENVPRFALLVGWGPYLRNVSVTGNIVRASRIGCAVSVVEDAGSALITDNIFEGMQEGAIIGFRWHDASTPEMAGGDAAFRHLTIDGNRVA